MPGRSKLPCASILRALGCCCVLRVLLVQRQRALERAGPRGSVGWTRMGTPVTCGTRGDNQVKEPLLIHCSTGVRERLCGELKTNSSLKNGVNGRRISFLSYAKPRCSSWWEGKGISPMGHLTIRTLHQQHIKRRYYSKCLKIINKREPF